MVHVDSGWRVPESHGFHVSGLGQWLHACKQGHSSLYALAACQNRRSGLQPSCQGAARLPLFRRVRHSTTSPIWNTRTSSLQKPIAHRKMKVFTAAFSMLSMHQSVVLAHDSTTNDSQTITVTVSGEREKNEQATTRKKRRKKER